MRAINLIPREQRRGAGGLAGRTGGVVYVLVATLIAIVALGVAYVFAVHSVATRTTTLAQVTAQASAVNAQVGALQPYVTFESVSKQRVAGVAALAEERFDWPDAMQQLALALPPGVHLVSLSGSAAGSGGTAGTTGSTGTTAATSVNAPTLTLSGCAPAQDTVALTLSRLRELQNVTAVNVSNYDKSPGCGVSFNMMLTYDSSYAIPSGTLKPGPHSTVGG